MKYTLRVTASEYAKFYFYLRSMMENDHSGVFQNIGNGSENQQYLLESLNISQVCFALVFYILKLIYIFMLIRCLLLKLILYLYSIFRLGSYKRLPFSFQTTIGDTKIQLVVH